MDRICIIVGIITMTLGCATPSTTISTSEDRLALFNFIYDKTLEREAFSPIKEQNLGIDVQEEMMKLKDEVVDASSETELYFALHKLSCARKDRHLSISPVKGGISPDMFEGGTAPIRFLPDYSHQEIVVFVSDVTSDIGTWLPEGMNIELGDVLVAINGQRVDAYYNDVEPYIRYSTINNLKRNFTSMISVKNPLVLPATFYQEALTVTLRNSNGDEYTVELPYLADQALPFVEAAKHKYSGYTKAFERQTYHLYLPDEPDNRRLVLWWYGFREDLPGDMDELVEYASENGLLEYDLIIDLTDSRGGSRGAYAIQRLSPLPFKATFGNLRLSDMAADFVSRREEAYAQSREFKDGSAKETDDDGTWLINWLREDVVPRMEAGEDYSSNVPFKCAHAPHTSDGILYPAPLHFKGRMVCLFGPKGGSHLDQFSSMVNDNNLGHSIGMAAGGYSNTWEGSEVLTFPISGTPVVEFMWSIGHTIRSNGEILEGNPADVDAYVPLTRENFRDYVPSLLQQAEIYLDSLN